MEALGITYWEYVVSRSGSVAFPHSWRISCAPKEKKNKKRRKKKKTLENMNLRDIKAEKLKKTRRKNSIIIFYKPSI